MMREKSATQTDGKRSLSAAPVVAGRQGACPFVRRRADAAAVLITFIPGRCAHALPPIFYTGPPAAARKKPKWLPAAPPGAGQKQRGERRCAPLPFQAMFENYQNAQAADLFPPISKQGLNSIPRFFRKVYINFPGGKTEGRRGPFFVPAADFPLYRSPAFMA